MKPYRIKISVILLLEILAAACCIAGMFSLSQEHIWNARAGVIADSIISVNTDPSTLYYQRLYAISEEEKDEEYEHRWKGPVLSRSRGSVMGPSGKETYYNLNMSGVVRIMRSLGYTGEYWIREDGCKMLGDYIMVAANYKIRPRGTIVETSRGKGIVCDTGGFAKRNPYQIDLAVNW